MPKEGNNIKNGISIVSYLQACLADHSRRLAAWNPDDPDSVFPEMPDELQILQHYEELSDDQLDAEYDKLLHDNPLLWEYSNNMDEHSKGAASLPKWVRNTGDRAALTQYLQENKDELSYEQQYLIRQRIAATDKKLQRQAEGEAAAKLPPVNIEPRPNGDEAIELADVHQAAKQNSGAGCWSVFLSNLAASRGIKLGQEEIRAYRPELSRQEAQNTKVTVDSSYNADTINNALERADGILSFMPGQMLCELEINQYSRLQAKNGISREQFEQKAVDQLKTTIKHALKEDRSPVGLLAGGHYLTIVGIDGDTIRYKDSAGNDIDPDHTYTGSLASIASGVLGDPGVFGIQLTWMKEIQLSKDGRTIFGVPSDYVRMKPDGTVQGQPGPILVGGGMPEKGLAIHKEGIAVSRYAGTEDTKPEQEYRPLLTDGIVKTEKVYLPKKLNAAALKSKADARPDEEERRLRQTDNSYYKLNRALQPVMEDPGVPDYVPAMTAAEQRFESELGDSWKNSIENGLSFVKIAGAALFQDLGFITAEKFDLNRISAEERQHVKNLCLEIFGNDLRETPVFDSDSALHNFTYKKTANGNAVNIWDEVESELRKDPLYADADNETIRSFVRPLILRAMLDKDADLSFENGAKSVRGIYAEAAPEIFPDEKAENENRDELFIPNAYEGDDDEINPFGGKAVDYGEDPYDIPDIEKYDLDKLLESMQEEENGLLQDAEGFPNTVEQDELPHAFSEDINAGRQPNPFEGFDGSDAAADPYAEDAEAWQPNPFAESDMTELGNEMYTEAALADRENEMLFKEPETEETYAVQRNTEEKLWFTAIYLAKGYALRDGNRSYTEAEEQKKSEIIADSIYDEKTLREAFNTLAAIETKAFVDIGEEAGRVEERLNITGNKGIAADYLVKEGSSAAIQLGRGCYELEFLMRDRLEELKQTKPELFAGVDFDRELEAARNRYKSNRFREADRQAYERGKRIYDAEGYKRPDGVFPAEKNGKNAAEFDRILHAKKPVRAENNDRLQDLIDKGRGSEMPTNFVNTYYKELDALRKLVPAAEKIRNTIRSDGAFYADNRYALGSVDVLVRDLGVYYTKGEASGEYPSLDGDALVTLRGRYTRNIDLIKGLRDRYEQNENRKYIERHSSKRVGAKELKPFNDVLKLLADDLKVVDKAFKARQKTTLPLAAFKYSKELEQINYVNGVFKHPGLVEFSRIYARSNMSNEEIRKHFIRSTPGQVESEYRKALAVNPWLSEYLPKDNKIPSRIENTSDVKQIEDYIKRNDLLLTDQEKAHLQNHINSANRAENINIIADNCFEKLEDYYDNGKRKPAVVISGEESAELDVHQDEWQTSTNGCWSVAGAMMVNSLGGQRFVKQEDLRNYRPKLKEGEVFDKNGMMDSAYTDDRGKDLMDMGDSILRFAPNKMMRQLDIQPYDAETEKKGIAPEEYLANAQKLFKKQILHSIKNDKCPVAFLKGDHYITITGIDGDTVKYKDSNEVTAKRLGVGPDHTYSISIKELIADDLTGPQKNRKPIKLTWLSDIKLNKDLSGIFGVPSKYAKVESDGSILQAPDDISAIAEMDNSVANREGVRFYRLGGDEENNRIDSKDRELLTDGGIIKVEKAYLPKQVNFNYLMHEADRRSPEEERQLNEADIELLGIDRNRAYNLEHLMDVDEHGEYTDDLPDVPYQYTDDEPKRGGSDSPDAPSGDASALDKKTEVLKKIGKAAGELDKKLEDSTPWYINRFTDLLRISGRSEDFEHLKAGIERLKELTEAALKKDAKDISDDELKEIIRVMEASANASAYYLQHKSEQFAADASRKDSKSKSGTEQARIRAAIDSYGSLSVLKADMNALVLNRSEAYTDIEKKKSGSNVKDYNDLLISKQSRNAQQMQDESFRNRTDIPEKHMRRLVRLEAVFGKKPEFLEEFKDGNRIKYKEVRKGDSVEKVSEFTQLTEINGEFKGIGPAGEKSILSDKDFVAIAVAETSEKEIFRAEYDKLKEYKVFEGLSFETIANNYASHTYDCFCSELLDKLTGAIPFAEKARQKAAEDLRAYERGDKKPLARVIANGLNAMTRKWVANNHALLDSGGEYLINSEIGQRMYRMLERDPELMMLARSEGLKPETYFNLKAMEKEGRNVLLGNDLLNGALNKEAAEKDKLWEDKDIKEERFAEILMHEAVIQENNKAEKRKEKNVDEIRENIENADNEYAERLRIAKARKTLAVIRAYSDRADFRQIAEAFNRRCTEEGITDKDTVDNSEKFVDLVSSFNGDVELYTGNKKDELNRLELELMAYYKDEIDAIVEKSRLEGKIRSFGDLARLDYAVTESKKFILECEKKTKEGTKLTPEEDEKYKYLRDIMDRYASLGSDAKKLGGFERQKQDETSYIKLRQLIVDNDLKLKYVDQNPISENLNDVSVYGDLKERLKVYMRYKGFDKLSPTEFARKINTYSEDISRDLVTDLMKFERDLKAGKISLNEQPLLKLEEEKLPEVKKENVKETGGPVKEEKAAEPERKIEKKEFDEAVKDFLINKDKHVRRLGEMLDPLSEFFGNTEYTKLCDDITELVDALNDLDEKVQAKNDEEIKTAYDDVYAKLEKVLLSKYQPDDGGEEKTGFEMLLGENGEGVKLSEIYGGGYKSLSKICEQFGLTGQLAVSDDLRKEIGNKVITAVDSLREKFEKIKKEEGDKMSPDIRAAFDRLYEKISPEHKADLREIREAVKDLKEQLKENDVREVSRALNIFNHDIANATRGMSFLDGVALDKIMLNEPADRLKEEKAADKEDVKEANKQKNAVPEKHDDKITAKDILDVKIDLDDKKDSGADRKSVRISIGELKSKDDAELGKTADTADRKTGSTASKNKTVEKKKVILLNN